jgi:hypothetical protein
MLWRSEETGASIALIKFDKGAGVPQPHFHSSNQFMFCLRGRYEYTSTGGVASIAIRRETFTALRLRTKRPWSLKSTTARIIRKNRLGTLTNKMRGSSKPRSTALLAHHQWAVAIISSALPCSQRPRAFGLTLPMRWTARCNCASWVLRT